MDSFPKTFVLIALALCGALALAAPALAVDADQLFGHGRSNVHPSLTVKEIYTDNYRQTETDEESEWTTVISPQLLVALPGIDKHFELTSLNYAPGGAAQTHFMGDAGTGFQGVALYRADIEYNQEFSENDGTYHSAQGLLQYAFPFGLTLEVSDIYNKNYDDYSEAGEERSDYDDNRVAVGAHYTTGNKLSFQLGYADYRIDYSSRGKAFQERKDQSWNAAVYYQVLPKTRLFLEYERIDVDYDQDIVSDFTEDHYFVGVHFDPTARISGYLKVGYGEVDPDQDGYEDSDEMLFEGSLSYQVGAKSSVTLTGRRQVQATVDEFHQDVLSTQVYVSFSHKLTHKLQMTVDAGMIDEDYRYDGTRSDRNDDVITAGVSLEYALRDWLTMRAGYDYEDRDSDVVGNDYTSNMVTASVAFAF